MYNVKHDLAPLPVQEIFTKNLTERYGDWVIPNVRTTNNGIERIRYRGPLLWNIIPEEIKSATSLNSF